MEGKPEKERSFADFLREVEDGTLHDELTQQLQELVTRMFNQATSTGGKPVGALALNLKFKLEAGVFEVVSDVKVQPPKPIRMRSIFYRDPAGGLTPNNPRQIEMGFGSSSEPDRAPSSIRAMK